MKYYGHSSTVYEVPDESLSKGGEGRIFEVIDKPEIVLKIYHNTPNSSLEKKLQVMCRLAKSWSADFRQFCTPPLDVIYDGNKIVGYAMRRLQGSFKPLQEIYDSYRGAGISYPNKIRAAMNLCSLTYLAHKNGIVIGDYNQKNIGVAPNGILSLFDNDSFQITDGGRTYRCIVGVMEEMAPEILLQLKKERANLITVSKDVYNQYTDRYTMALHIFHLLMNGAHPFNREIDASKLPESQTVSSASIPVTEAAMRKDFIIAHPKLFARPPKWVPDYNILSPKLQACFERAFVDGLDKPEKRPSPEEFFDALNEYLQGQQTYPQCGHVHYKDFHGNCEWCRIRKKSK